MDPSEFWAEIGQGEDEWNQFSNIIIEAFANDPWLLSQCKTTEKVKSCIAETLPWHYEKYIREENGDFAVIKTKRNGNVEIVGGVCITYCAQSQRNETGRPWSKMTVEEKKKDILDKLFIEPMCVIAERHGREVWYGFKQAISPRYQSMGIGGKLLTKASLVFLKHGIQRRNLLKPPIMVGDCISAITNKFVKTKGDCISLGSIKFFVGSAMTTLELHALPISGDNENTAPLKEAREIFVGAQPNCNQTCNSVLGQ